MNRDRQVRSRLPVQQLNRRQAAQATRTREDYGSDVLTEAGEEDEYDDVWPPRLSSSARPYVDMTQLRGQRYVLHPDQVQRIPQRRTAVKETGSGERQTEEAPKAKPKRQRRGLFAHPLLYIGMGMLLMLALWVGLQALLSWWQLHQDDATYGYPRIWQTDAIVGHNNDNAATPSHFLFLNLNRHIEIIEELAGDPSKIKVYLGPTLFSDHANLIPVTGEFRDVNGDGKLDMIVHIQDSRFVFLNEDNQFRPLKPGEHVTL